MTVVYDERDGKMNFSRPMENFLNKKYVPPKPLLTGKEPRFSRKRAPSVLCSGGVWSREFHGKI